ncbi:MAG: hypothetical protein GC168_17530 [Candidatus Hydrogenedens sp.]|nr:hypothetical protein [Candidatus Hydrogenedens sp.]
MRIVTRFFLSLLLLSASALASAAPATIGSPRLMQGPMIGAVTTTAIPVWVRASGDFDCWLKYADNPDLADAAESPKVRATKDNDYTAVLTMEGLKPGTRYYYRVYVHDGVAKGMGGVEPFHADSAPESPGRFRVCYGSCPRWGEDRIQPIWSVVNELEPDLFFWLGDNIYGDALDPDILAEEYRRQRDVTGLQPLIHSTPQLAIWDDHDYGLNDHNRTNPVKDLALGVFKQYWPNPAYGLPDAPGVFFQYSYGGVDFFFLDGRYYRDPNAEKDSPEKTMLGQRQLAWLKDGLKASTAAFKVLISGSGFNNGKGEGGDSWAAFLHERNALLDYIRDEAIPGVFVLSGDTHMGEANAIPWSEHGGYDIYDFDSSPLGQIPATDNYMRRPEMRLREPYNAAANAGVLDFDFTGDVPQVTFQLMTQYGLYAWSPIVVRADELVNGVASAAKKRDTASKEWERFTDGGLKALKK